MSAGILKDMADDYIMTADDMPEQTRRLMTEAEKYEAWNEPPPAEDTPEYIAAAFCDVLVNCWERCEQHGVKPVLDWLLAASTPESWKAWNGFVEAIKAMKDIDNPAWPRTVQPSDDPDVVYFNIHSAPEGSFIREPGDVSLAEAALTLVYRPDAGGWKVHSMGRMLPPERVPHGLPGEMRDPNQ